MPDHGTMANQDQTSQIHPAPVPLAPAPWTCKSEIYWMFITLKECPPSAFHNTEANSPLYSGPNSQEKFGEFKGGLGCVMVVRYTDTPVGTYDELALIPGKFTVPASPTTSPEFPKKALRMGRFYVSQRTTTYNGRLNWNVPKQLARFWFSHPITTPGSSPPESLSVKVYPPGSKEGDGVKPFFACTIKPWRWVPTIPVSSKYLPLDLTMVNPPLVAAPGHKEAVESELQSKVKIDEYDIDPAHQAALLVGTESWFSFPIMTWIPRARGCWVTSYGMEGEVDGSEQEVVEEAERWWPQNLKPWSVGGFMQDAEMSLPVPKEWKVWWGEYAEAYGR